MAKKHQRRGMADHTADPTCKRRMKISRDLNDVYDNEYDSTKLLIPNDVLDLCKGFISNLQVIISILTRTYNV